jgi:3-oxoacid CoA-transferase subunit A
VLAHECGCLIVIGNAGANARDLVRRHTDSDSATAHHHATFACSVSNELSDSSAEIWIVDALVSVSTYIGYFVADVAQVGREGVLEVNASMVRSDGNTHVPTVTTKVRQRRKEKVGNFPRRRQSVIKVNAEIAPSASRVPSMKVFTQADQALEGLTSGMTVAVGGFGLGGIPWVLCEAIAALPVDNLTLASNNPGLDGLGAGRIISAGKVSRMISSYVGENKEFERQYLTGEITLELTPQGTLAERLRAGGSGIAGFYTQTGVGTQVADGGLPWRYNADGSIALASPAKERKSFDGKEYVLEEAIIADFAIVRAHTVDESGNAVFRRSSRNFNLPAAMSGRVTVVEAENVVPVGTLDPDQIHLPGVYVHRILALTPEQAKTKHIERRTVRTKEES